MPLLMCPNDNSAMQEIDRNGVLIDVCPECRGVWMDRGELEKLLDIVGRSGPADGGRERDTREPDRRYEQKDRYESKDRYEHKDRNDHRKKKKKRFELFDFFD